MSEDYTIFLGTAGARFVMAQQRRASAGIYLHLNGRRIFLDPGPGALVACSRHRPRIDPAQTDSVVLTHGHIDHSGDVNAVIDAMTAGGWNRRGEVFAPRDCLEGVHRVVLNYLHEYPERMVALEPQTDYRTGEVAFATSAPHHHGSETYGIRFRRAQGDLSFVADTRWFDELPASYQGSRTLVVSVVLLEPPTKPAIQHLCVAEAEDLLDAVQPQKAVLTHFGTRVLEAGPEQIADRMSKRLGMAVLAARDGMRMDVGA